MTDVSIIESTSEFVRERKDYFKQWIFEEPLVISKSHNDEMAGLQKIMYKLIVEFVKNYPCYKDLMPVSQKVEEIIGLFNQKEYNIGTYRTDFVYDSKQRVKLIEITCRFALNGMFSASLMNSLAEEYHSKHFKEIAIKDHYEAIYKHFNEYLEGVDSIVVLKGGDLKNESKIYVDIFKRMGYPLRELPFAEIADNLDGLENSWILSELSFDEICSLDSEVIKKMMPLNIMNDFRTVFLIHDKRFFSVLGNSRLREAALTKEEIEFFEKFYIPTYSFSERKDLWDDAKLNKNNWIIKHRSLGKSEKVYAGIVTDEKLWDSLFLGEDVEDLILQEWIHQTTVKGKIKNQNFDDFITGTLLFFDNEYYGFGEFRTSSFPVTNQGDHRKACSIIRADDAPIDLSKVTNYIN